jgi:hypothetical protein
MALSTVLNMRGSLHRLLHRIGKTGLRRLLAFTTGRRNLPILSGIIETKRVVAGALGRCPTRSRHLEIPPYLRAFCGAACLSSGPKRGGSTASAALRTISPIFTSQRKTVRSALNTCATERGDSTPRSWSLRLSRATLQWLLHYYADSNGNPVGVQGVIARDPFPYTGALEPIPGTPIYGHPGERVLLGAAAYIVCSELAMRRVLPSDWTSRYETRTRVFPMVTGAQPGQPGMVPFVKSPKPAIPWQLG